MLNWADQFSILLYLDSNEYNDRYPGYEFLLAVGSVSSIIENNGDALVQLQSFHDAEKDWLFGHISYDYKNMLEPRLSSSHSKHMGFPQIYFFQPEVVIYVRCGEKELHIETLNRNPHAIFEDILHEDVDIKQALPSLNFLQRIDKETYLNTIEKLRHHIADGDCYEINFCNEGYCPDVAIDPLQVFKVLNTLSPAPFASYYRLEDDHMMCASPERYLRKEGNAILSQPIKGTARRDKDPEKDLHSKTELQANIKERAENVMIVDLVRNDLARSCSVGSVNVEELFGIYSFPQVHQMISTIIGQLKEECSFTDAIRYSFPMGSMTGAPKYKVMELIEQYEHCRRELFSGTVGYITPDGGLDFNVVIRSLFYNAASQYLSYQTGGAITFDSDPEKEWEEMRLKAWALERIFA